MDIIVLVLPRPAHELRKELISLRRGVALPVSQAPMVQGRVRAGKAISSPLPQPPPARWQCLRRQASKGRERLKKKRRVWQ